MLEAFDHLYTASSWLSWRELIRVVLLSGLFTLVCLLAFPRNAPSKRILLMISAATLAVLPWLIKGDWLVWHFPLDDKPTFSLSQGLPDALMWAWLVVAGLLMVHLIAGVARELRRIHQLPRVAHAPTDELLRQMCQQVGLSTPALRQGSMACSTSLGRPTVVLPAQHVSWDESTLRSVLAHELVHIQRRDDVWLLLFRACVLCYWWMPWINTMYVAFLRCIEESCDDAAAHWVGHDLTYATALAGVASHAMLHTGKQKTPASASTRFSSLTNMHQHHLVGRIGRFAQLRQVELDTRGLYWSVTGILAAVLFLSGVEPVQRTYAALSHDQTGIYLTSRANRAGQSVYPSTYQYTLFPEPVSAVQQRRLHNPSYAAPVIYPGTAIRQGVEGSVTVALFVNGDGAVSNPRIVDSNPGGVFDGAALRAVLNSRYLPAPAQASRQSRVGPAQSLNSVEIHRYFAFRLEHR